MTNKEKANELARGCFSKRTVDSSVNKLEQLIIKDACLKAIEWKEKQMLDKACEWLKENIYNRVYKCGDDLGFPTAQFIEDFRKAMEE